MGACIVQLKVNNTQYKTNKPNKIDFESFQKQWTKIICSSKIKSFWKMAKTVKKWYCFIKLGKCYYSAWLIVTSNDPDSIRIGSGSPGKICQKFDCT